MKKRISFITILAILSAAIILNLLLFTVMPEKIQAYPSFWLVWAFTFPVNLVIAIALVIYSNCKDGVWYLRIPFCYYIAWTFAVIYFGVGFKLMFVPFSAKKIGIPLAIELAITVVYIILLLVSLLGVSYIESNQKLVKKKVFYIRDLKTDIESTLSYVSDPALKKQLEKLAEAIRFSDPMSHASLAEIESELSSVVRSIALDARTEAGADEIAAKVKKANSLLEYRNEKCKILK